VCVCVCVCVCECVHIALVLLICLPNQDTVGGQGSFRNGRDFCSPGKAKGRQEGRQATDGPVGDPQDPN